MSRHQRSQYEVWAYLGVSPKSTRLITEFFVEEYNIKPEYIAPEMHLTIYHARRPMPLLEESAESHIIAISTLETRFMVLSPGGEDPRPYLVPARERVGIRIKKNNNLRKKIKEFRSTFFPHEDKKVLGRRKPSTHSKNAFGARNYQPHITILLKHSGIQRNLTEVGENSGTQLKPLNSIKSLSNPGKISRHKSNPAYKKTFISMKIAPNETSEIFKILLDQDYCNPLSDEFDFKIFTEKATEIANELGYTLHTDRSAEYFDFFVFLNSYHNDIMERFKQILQALNAPTQNVFLGLLEILNFDFQKIAGGRNYSSTKLVRRFNMKTENKMQTFFGETVDRDQAIDTGIDSVNIAIRFIYKYNTNTNRKIEGRDRENILNASRKLLTYANVWFVLSDLLEAYKYKFIELNLSGKHADFAPFPKPYHLFTYAGKERYRSHILEPFIRMKTGLTKDVLEMSLDIKAGEAIIIPGKAKIENKMAGMNFGVILNYFFHLNQVKLKNFENLTVNDLYLIVTNLQFAFSSLVTESDNDDNVPIRISKENLLSYLNKSTNLSKSVIKKCIEVLSSHFAANTNLWNTPLISFGKEYYFFLSSLIGSQVMVVMQRLIDQALSKKQQLEKFNSLVEIELMDTKFELARLKTELPIIPNDTFVYKTGNNFVTITTFLYDMPLDPVDYYSTLVDAGSIALKLTQFCESAAENFKKLSKEEDFEVVKIVLTNLPMLSGINIEGCALMDLTLIQNYLSKGYYEQAQIILGNGKKDARAFVHYDYYKNEAEFGNRLKYFSVHPDPVEEIVRRYKFEQRQLLKGFTAYTLTTTNPEELKDSELSWVFIKRIEHYLRLFYYFGNSLEKEENQEEKDIAESRITFLLPQTFNIVAFENTDRFIRLELIRVFEDSGLSGTGFLVYLANAMTGKIVLKNTIPSPEIPEVLLDDKSIKNDLDNILKTLHENHPVTMSQFNGNFELEETNLLQILDLLVFQLGRYHQKYSKLEEFNELLMSTTLLALISRAKPEYNHFVLKAFLNLIDALNFNQYYQKARDVSEEILEYCFKNHDTPVIGWLCLLKCYVKQKNINEAFIYANLVLAIIDTLPEVDETLYKETYYELLILFRELHMLENVKGIFTILEKTTTDEYEKQKLHLSYYNAYLTHPEELKPLLLEIWEYLNGNVDGILKYGQASALPWIGFLFNLNHLMENGHIIEDSKWSIIVEKLKVNIDSDSLDHLSLLFGEDYEKSTGNYKAILQRIFETRSYDDLTKEIQNIALVSHKIVKQAIDKKDFEVIFLYGLLNNDQNLTFKELISPAKSRIDEAVQTEWTKRINDYKSYIGANLNLNKSQKLLWIFSVHETVYLLEFLSDSSFTISTINSWDIDKMDLWIAALSGFHFPDMSEYFITDQEHAYVRLLKDLQPFRVDLAGDFDEVLLYTDLQLGKFPFNLILGNNSALGKNTARHEEVVTDEIKQSGYDFISYHKPITNVVSLEWFIENCQKLTLPSESFSVEAWSPTDDKDIGLQITWDSLAPVVEQTYLGKLNTERVPSTPLAGAINMFLAHGGKDMEGFKTIYTREQDGYAILKDKGIEKVIGKGTVAVLFICNSAYISKKLFAERLMSFTQQILSLGYKAVIAPAWSLNSEIVTSWSKIFLSEMKNGSKLGFAVQAANVGISKQGYREYIGFYDPSGWAGMHVYGNPNISFAVETKPE